MCKAIDIVKWFMLKQPEGLTDSFEGNMKANKLLYFAQLVSLALRDKALFSDDIYAFKHGMVVESVRNEYKKNYYNLKNLAKFENLKFDEDEEEILNITNEIFGCVSANELSKLTHEHRVWKDYYEHSKGSNWHYKSLSKININAFFDKYRSDLEKVKEVLDAYKSNIDSYEEECIEINGVKYYYNPLELEINDCIVNELEKYPATESAYTIYIDSRQGLVVY